MKKSLAYLLSGMMTLGLVGCGGSSTGTTTPTAGATAGTTTTGDGATSMVVAIGAQFDTLDPQLSTTLYNSYVINSIYAALTKINADSSTSYDLAESSETSEDGLTWTFHLNKDVTFNDGTPITSANYVYSYLRALSYGVDNAFRVNDMQQMIKGAQDYSNRAYEAGDAFDCTTEDHSDVGIEAPDDYTLVLTLNYPVPYFLTTVAGGGVFSPLPLDTPQHTSDWSVTPGYATCGEYELAEFSLNDKAVLKKSDTYYGKDAVKMDEITYQVMPDVDAQYAAFQTGDVDVALSVSVSTALSYKGTDNLWVLTYPSCYSLVLNCGETGPDFLKDVNVRKALYEAIDKEALVDVIGGEEIYPVLNGYVPFGLFGETKDFRTERDEEGYESSYNPEEAKALLEAAGYSESNPLKFTYKYSKNSIHEDVATMLQSMWKALGCVEVDFDAVESGVYYDQLDQGDFQIGRYGLQAEASPINFLKNWTSANLVYNSVNDPKYDKMIDDAKYITDPTEFAKALHEAEDYLVQEQFLEFPLFQFSSPALVSSSLSGYELHSTMPYFSACVKD